VPFNLIIIIEQNFKSKDMHINWLVIFISAIVPMLIGFIWYHPKVLGAAWMKASGLDEEKIKGGNMALIFGVSFFLSLLIAMSLQFVVIHQTHIYSIFANDPEMKNPASAISLYVKDFMDKYGNNFRTFKHGVLHGIIAGIFLILPVIGITALFERKGFKYIFINAGYWIVSLAIMGGIICEFNK
jgi:hypothetical protein